METTCRGLFFHKKNREKKTPRGGNQGGERGKGREGRKEKKGVGGGV